VVVASLRTGTRLAVEGHLLIYLDTKIASCHRRGLRLGALRLCDYALYKSTIDIDIETVKMGNQFQQREEKADLNCKLSNTSRKMDV